MIHYSSTLAVLPKEWFADLSTWLLVLIAVVALAVVIKGADWLVEAAAGIAYRLGMPKVVVGATIVSLGTTSPETAVSVLAAFSGNSGLALGNGVGSVIADTGLIFGLGCVLTRLPADRFILSRQGWVQFGVAALLAAYCYAKWLAVGDSVELAWYIGVILLAILVWYLWASVRWARQHHTETEGLIAESSKGGEEVDVAEAANKKMWVLWAMGVAGLAMVVVAGDGAVNSASVLALRFGVPEVVLAATLVAFGTSLPELVVGITSIRKGHAGLLVGNVIGADILNILWVIGLSAIGGSIAGAGLPLIETLGDGSKSYVFLWLHLPAMLAMLVFFRLCIFKASKDGHFSRWMGVPLLAMYGVFVALQLWVR